MVCFGSVSWMIRVDAVVYDLDETLIDSERLHCRAWRHAARDCGLALSPQFLRAQRGRTSDEAAQLLLGPRYEELGPRLVARKRQYVRQHAHEVALFDDVTPAWRRLSELGFHLGVCTSSDREFCRAVFETHPVLAELASFTIARDDYRYGKPSGEPLLCACLRAAVRPSRCLYVGDASSDYLAAFEAGCPFVLYARDRQRATLFPARVRHIRDHRELALHLIQGPPDRGRAD
jgi:phosphoglycolate phosphatase-like HAD superfamily hydrolase